jgi:Coenzyme PQQ synthesis protein D (PqqD)
VTEPRPQRAEGVEVNLVADGYVVYDAERDRVHYLNHTAALVLEFCDGQNTRADVVELLQATFELDAPPEQEVNDCLERLQEEGLVV